LGGVAQMDHFIFSVLRNIMLNLTNGNTALMAAIGAGFALVP